MRYAVPQVLVRALSYRLMRCASEDGVDLERLRKRMASERFLVRLQPLTTPTLKHL